jgi:hypothetical protein
VPRNFSRGRGVIPSLAERGSSLVSMGTSSLEYSILKCSQVYSTLCCLTTLQDATFQTGSTHADKTAPPRSARDGKTPLPRLKLGGTNSTSEWKQIRRSKPSKHKKFIQRCVKRMTENHKLRRIRKHKLCHNIFKILFQHPCEKSVENNQEKLQ